MRAVEAAGADGRAAPGEDDVESGGAQQGETGAGDDALGDGGLRRADRILERLLAALARGEGLLLGLDEVPQPHDASDALAVAICHAMVSRSADLSVRGIMDCTLALPKLPSPRCVMGEMMRCELRKPPPASPDSELRSASSAGSSGT